MTNHESINQSDWVDCQGGEISGLVRRLKSQRSVSRRRQVMQSLSVAAGLLVIVGIGWMVIPGDNSTLEAKRGGITCSDVVENGKQYILNELDPELAERINAHLGKCENCQKKLSMLRDRLGLSPDKLDKKQPNEQTVVSTITTIASAILP